MDLESFSLRGRGDKKAKKDNKYDKLQRIPTNLFFDYFQQFSFLFWSNENTKSPKNKNKTKTKGNQYLLK